MKVERFDVASAATKVQQAPRRGDLSDDQRDVFDTLLRWVDEKHLTLEGGHVTLGGLAGTGKTTIVSALAAKLERTVVFTAYTGKAVDVLSRKLRSYGINAPAMTLHSLMYRPIFDEKTGAVIEWAKRPELYLDAEERTVELVIVDEASMLSADLWADLRSYGVPIIAVGDHGQLPPIGRDAISLLAKPDLRLEKIHRQAEGNPIISFAHFVREGGRPRAFKPPNNDGRVTILPRVETPDVLDLLATDSMNTALLCYFNKTRVRFNAAIRKHRNFVGPDVVICLRNANKIIYNGMRGVLLSISEVDERGRALATVEFPEHGLRIIDRLCLMQFGREKTFASPSEVGEGLRNWSQTGLLFDYGYALTCHKAQGSQWTNVVVKHEVLSKDTEDTKRRWIYTAATRAAEQLFVA